MRRGSRDETELRRALWRFEHGQLASLRMGRILRLEYQRTSREFARVFARSGVVERHEPALLAARDGFLSQAARAVNVSRHRVALDEIVRGRAALSRILSLLEADARVEEAASAHARLLGWVRARRLRSLPCVDTPGRLLKLAREHLASGRHAQALYLAAASFAHTEAVSSRDPDADAGDAAALRARLEAIHALCEETQEMGDDGVEPVDAETLRAALELVRDGRLALVDRMADELAFTFAARDRFRRELRRSGDDGALLREAASTSPGRNADVWSSASAALWRARVESGLRRQADHRARVEHAGAELPPATPPTSTRTHAAGTRPAASNSIPTQPR